MADYRKLRVWHKADALAKVVYTLAETTLGAGHTELADQMKRAALSVPANIAEGVVIAAGRSSRGSLPTRSRHHVSSKTT
jgi:four helix bundle protein